jgi:hypothetical protein
MDEAIGDIQLPLLPLVGGYMYVLPSGAMEVDEDGSRGLGSRCRLILGRGRTDHAGRQHRILEC